MCVCVCVCVCVCESTTLGDGQFLARAITNQEVPIQSIEYLKFYLLKWHFKI